MRHVAGSSLRAIHAGQRPAAAQGASSPCLRHAVRGGSGAALRRHDEHFCVRDSATAPVILDGRVATWLRRHTPHRTHPGSWSPRTYGRCLEHVHGWATQLGVTAGLVEELMFGDDVDNRW